MRIGGLELKHGIALAPMAGVTDSTFRRLCRRYGAEYCVTEMISAKAIHYGDRKTSKLAVCMPEEHPVGLQLFGSEPAIMAEAAARMYEDFAPDVIDINMGCPVRKIVGNGEGSALLANPELAAEIVAAVAAAVPVPVTVKLRIGIDSERMTGLALARAVEQAGASMLCVHGRTRVQMYRPPVSFPAIRAICEAVRIPVMANGDIRSASDARRMREATGCDGVMIGRGACGNPWIFAELLADAEGRNYDTPTADVRVETAIEHLSMVISDKGERVGVCEARKHIAWYLYGLPGAAAVRGQINCMTDAREIEVLLRAYAMRPEVREADGRPGITPEITDAGQDGL